MAFGKNYSLIYDLLYKNKNYNKEAKAALKVVLNYKKKINNLLEIGCGSGNFTKILIKKNYSITAIDPSVQMINLAKKKIKSKKVQFLNCKSTNLRIKKKYDVALSLFHVFSYHIKKKEINLFFKNLSKRLVPGGILIFDFWFKPAVINLKPMQRVKIVENEKFKIIRKVTPIWKKKNNIVISCYLVNLIDKKKGQNYLFKENHFMRYFSLNEVKKKLKQFGFEFKSSFDIISQKPVSKYTWGATVVAEKLNKQ